jgi:hypothetical protein
LNNVREYKFKALFENQTTGIRTWFYVGIGDKIMPEWGARVTEWLQYMGLPDKNGNELWESDIIENEHKERYLIVWDGTGFKAALNGSKKAIYSANEYWFKSCKKIGNIWDNPELLKEGNV